MVQLNLGSRAVPAGNRCASAAVKDRPALQSVPFGSTPPRLSRELWVAPHGPTTVVRERRVHNEIVQRGSSRLRVLLDKQVQRVARSVGQRNAKDFSASSSSLPLSSRDLAAHFNALKFSPSLISESLYSVGTPASP